MNSHNLYSIVGIAVGMTFAATGGLSAQTPITAEAELIDREGQPVGQVGLQETADYGVLMDVEISGLPPGTHAIHIHETGSCEGPTFESAGGHYAPRGNAHGILSDDGAHVGDLLNLQIPESGDVRTERLASEASLGHHDATTLLDEDGSAIVVHAGVDDYLSQPSGDAGERLACGVILQAEKR